MDLAFPDKGGSRWFWALHCHRSLAQASIPSLGCFAQGNRGPVATPDTGEHGVSPTNLASQRWFDRLPDHPQLEHLGLGLEQTRSTAYPRITALIGHLCSSQGWDPDEFVGYRCEVAYPVWGVQYLASFDFGDGEES